MASVSDWRARIPGMPTGTEIDTQISTALEDAARAVDLPRVASSNPEAAQVYLAAHLIALTPTTLGVSLGGESAGAPTAKKMGEISASFANASAGRRGGAYSSTTWGRMFEALLDTHAGIVA